MPSVSVVLVCQVHMLARERLPALARHLPSNKTPRALIFFHMAKTGGTSVIVERLDGPCCDTHAPSRLLALQLSHEMVGMGSFRLYAHGIARSDGLIDAPQAWLQKLTPTALWLRDAWRPLLFLALHRKLFPGSAWDSAREGPTPAWRETTMIAEFHMPQMQAIGLATQPYGELRPSSLTARNRAG